MQSPGGKEYYASFTDDHTMYTFSEGRMKPLKPIKALRPGPRPSTKLKLKGCVRIEGESILMGNSANILR